MGRWSYSNRWTTDECKSISVFFLRQHNFFAGMRSGGIKWSCAGVTTGSAMVFVSTVTKRAEYIQFKYTYTDNRSGESIELDYKVSLESTPCHFGGRRWWFLCPCGRRVGVLYRVGKNFRCRHCHNLVYESSREHRSLYEGFERCFALSDKYKKICEGRGRKGYSKIELAQLAKLHHKSMGLSYKPMKKMSGDEDLD